MSLEQRDDRGVPERSGDTGVVPQRLIEHALEKKVLDLLLQRISDLGLLRSGGRRRTDTTHGPAAVAVAGETLRAALEARGRSR